MAPPDSAASVVDLGSGPAVLNGTVVGALSVRLPGVFVALSGTVSGEALSDSDGTFTFLGLDPGTYALAAAGYDSVLYHFDRQTGLEIGADTVEVVYTGFRWLRLGASLPASPTFRDARGQRSGEETFVVDADPADVIDLGVFCCGSEFGGVVHGSDGSLVGRTQWNVGASRHLLTGWRVPEAAPVRLRVTFREPNYTVAARASTASLMRGQRPFPVEVPFAELPLGLGAPAGASEAVDTVWIRNGGPEGASWEAELDAEGWQHEPVAGVLPGGSVLGIEIRVDVGGLAAGETRSSSMAIRLPDDDWSGLEIAATPEARVYDASVEVLLRGLPFATGGVSATPWGELVFLAGGGVESWSPGADERTLLAASVVPAIDTLARAAVGPDGALYVAVADAELLRRIDGTGSSSTVFSLSQAEVVRGLTVASDGTVWVAARSELYRVAPDGSSATVYEGAVWAIALHEPTDAVYVLDDPRNSRGRLLRVESESGAVTDVGPLPEDLARSMAFDGDGRLYVPGGSAIAVYDNVVPADGAVGPPRLVRRVLTPLARSTQVAVIGDWVYGVTVGCCGNLLDRGLVFRVPTGVLGHPSRPR